MRVSMRELERAIRVAGREPRHDWALQNKHIDTDSELHPGISHTAVAAKAWSGDQPSIDMILLCDICREVSIIATAR